MPEPEKGENPLAALERWNTRNYYLIKRLENVKVDKKQTIIHADPIKLIEVFEEILIDVAERFGLLRNGVDENGELHLTEDDIEKAMKVLTSDYYNECRARRSNI